MKYRILFISSWYPNRLEPTNGNFVQRHAEAAALYHNVEVLHAIGVNGQKNLFEINHKLVNGIRTVIVYYRSSPFSSINFILRMRAYTRGFRKMQKPDLVHANILHNNLLFAVWLKKYYRIPFVVSEHWSLFLEENREVLTRSKKLIAKKIALESSFILPVSQKMKANLIALNIGRSFKVIGNVVDTDLFSAKTSQQMTPFVFLHISSLLPNKNPEAIIRTAARLHAKYSHFQLHIGGDGDQHNLEKLVAAHDANTFIKTFGTLTPQEVAHKMRRANCFILFSGYENFPCVLLESLSAGTPVIATNVGGIPEIVKTTNGILIGNNEEELFSAMEQMLVNGTENYDPAALHREIEQNYSVEQIAAAFSDIYNNVLAR